MNVLEVILVAKKVIFYARKDEEAFLGWLKAIKSVKQIDYQGADLLIYIKSKQISDHDLSDLLALFFRYKIKMDQLQIFLNDQNKAWFYDNSKMYWHKKVFN
jgi:hypothetical protein